MQMFLPYFLADIIALFLADVTAIVCCGRCYNHQADVVPVFVDGRCFASFIYACGRCCCHMFVWLMLLPFDVCYCGRCYCHH